MDTIKIENFKGVCWQDILDTEDYCYGEKLIDPARLTNFQCPAVSIQ